MATDNSELFNKYFTEAFNSIKAVRTYNSSNIFHSTNKYNLGTIIGRPIIDEKGRPFRVIDKITDVVVPNLQVSQSDIWRMKFMDPINYEKAGNPLTKEELEIMNRVIGKAWELSARDDEEGISGYNRVRALGTKKTTVMFMKIIKSVPSQLLDRYVPPSFDSISIITSTSSSFLSEFENRWKIKCESSGTKWIEKTFGRTEGPTDRFMMIKTRKKSPSEGIGFNVTMEFTEGDSIDITEKDLEDSKDLSDAFISPRFDIERALRIENLLDEYKEAKRSVLNDMSQEESPKVEPEIKSSADLATDDDFNF